MSAKTLKVPLPETLKEYGAPSPQNQATLAVRLREAQNRPQTVRPQFIIKKVQNEEVLENPLKLSNFMGLSQINEENADELDDLLSSSSDQNFNMLQPNLNNIFRAEVINAAKYKEYMKGPQYNQDGQIIKHSIIGSPVSFERSRKIGKVKSRDFIIDKGSLSDISTIKNIRQPSLGSQNSAVSTVSRPGTQGSTFSRKLNSQAEHRRNTKHDHIEPRLTNEQIVYQINHYKEIEEAHVKAESKTLGNLDLPDQLYFTKEERNLKKFDEVREGWEKTVQSLSSRVGREGKGSIMLAAENHRQKKELLQAIDAVKPDEERYGTMFWHRTLRQGDTKKIPLKTTISKALFMTCNEDMTHTGMSHTGMSHTGISHEKHERLYTSQSERQLASLEVIRMPRLIQTPSETFRSTEERPVGFTNEYVDQKFTRRNQLLIDAFRPPEVEKIKSLSVKGESKLSLEAEVVISKLKHREPVNIPTSFFTRHDSGKQEETIIKQRNPTAVIRHGLNAYVK